MDDSALMLATLASLLRDGATTDSRFDTADHARRFLAWADEGAYTSDEERSFDLRKRDVGCRSTSGYTRARRWP